MSSKRPIRLGLSDPPAQVGPIRPGPRASAPGTRPTRPVARGTGPRPRPPSRAKWLFLAVLLVPLVLLTPGSRREPPPPPSVPPPVDLPTTELRTWTSEVRRAEEARGEPTGRRAHVVVPAALQHEADRRMFLAVQVAESQEQDYELPEDDAELAALVRDGQMVEVPPFGDGYVLYGVGAHAGSEPFAHFERSIGVEIPLYDHYLDFEEADHAFDAAVTELQERRAQVTAQRARTSRRAARQRRALLGQMRVLEQREGALIRQQERTAEFYEDWERRRMLAGKLHELEQVARELGGREYDLRRPQDRRALRGRLLTFLRPEARAVMQQIAGEYAAAFDRPLPVTSLVRSYRYQRELRRSNPNATSIDLPPHSTGLAFDLLTRFMSATEQQFLMNVVARLEEEGRVEALREGNRDHLHVFAFADGTPPAASSIARSLELVAPPLPARPRTARGSRATRAPATKLPPPPAAPRSLPGLSG